MKHTLFHLLLTFALPNAFAQTFPLPGATWIFMGYGLEGPSGEKWEYQGDLVVADGVLKKMKVQKKSVYPNHTGTGLWLWEYDEHFLYKGDTVFDASGSVVLANFSMQVGDSCYTPYYSPNSLNTWTDSCTQAFILQKGVVVETGTENEDGVSFRYYNLKYKELWGDSVVITFSERSIINQAYWWYYFHQNPSGCDFTQVFDFATYSLACFYDDSSQVTECPEEAYFNQLSFAENLSKPEIQIYPNPATDVLNIHTPSNEPLTVSIIDMQGRVVWEKTQISGNSSIAIHDLAPSTYVLSYTKEDRTQGNVRFIKQ